MKKILFVGEHPFASSGNSGMLLGILSEIDADAFQASCFVSESLFVDPLPLLFQPLPFSLLIQPEGSDVTGSLLHILNKTDIDALVMVGLDIWFFRTAMKQIADVCNKRNVNFVAIFPYDLQEIRSDWVEWINMVDYPCVYSKYGEALLKPHVPNIRYFRPELHVSDIWVPFEDQKKAEIRKRIFPTVPDDAILFGFIGHNQFRKDPQGLIKAFSIAKKSNPNIRLFMHTDFQVGIFNLGRYAKDCGAKEGDILKKAHAGSVYKLGDMPSLYNCFDCLVNCTIQEGLSWTPLEAMLCGVPVIASASTSHTELVKDVGILVPCEEPAFVPVETEHGSSFVEAKKCKPEDIATAMIAVAKTEVSRKEMSRRGVVRGKEWLSGISDINELLHEVCSKRKTTKVIEVSKINAVLFAQHSAAGDVLMTTRCFKGIKDRYKRPLHYMTSPQYIDIIEGNPYVDKVIAWDPDIMELYSAVLNPHGERIAPGHWGRNCNSILSDFYWKILRVEPDDFYIEQIQPDRIEEKGFPEIGLTFFEENKKGILLPFFEASNPICIIHTTGGDSAFRTYKYMRDVIEGIKDRYTTVQLGSKGDFPAWADVDLRGKLSFRESAWVVARAKLAVTVDSFMSHLCGAFGISQVCLFGSGNEVVVKPNQVAGELICMSPDYVNDCVGLGPCSGALRKCPVPCTGRHDPKDILKAIEKIEGKNDG